LQRYDIVSRRITKVATKPTKEIVKITNAFIQYIRKRSRRKNAYQTTALRSSPPFDFCNWKTDSFRKSPLNLIINLNETLLLFEFLNGYSYDFKNARTMAGKSNRNGWDKRQTTIIFYIMADNSTPFKPTIIFYGKGIIARKKNYNDRVDIHFNDTAYNNEELFHTWLRDIYQPYIAQHAHGNEKSMIVMDVTATGIEQRQVRQTALGPTTSINENTKGKELSTLTSPRSRTATRPCMSLDLTLR
jgi:hypothetical protein